MALQKVYMHVSPRRPQMIQPSLPVEEEWPCEGAL
jgi:hypothetical protein